MRITDCVAFVFAPPPGLRCSGPLRYCHPRVRCRCRSGGYLLQLPADLHCRLFMHAAIRLFLCITCGYSTTCAGSVDARAQYDYYNAHFAFNIGLFWTTGSVAHAHAAALPYCRCTLGYACNTLPYTPSVLPTTLLFCMDSSDGLYTAFARLSGLLPAGLPFLI